MSADGAPRPLRQTFGVAFGVAVGIGSMIGAGILRTPADVASRLPHPALFFGVWVLGACYALLGANALAELSTMYPRSGGQYVYVRHALGGAAGFLVGWIDWVSTCGSVAAVALVLGEAAGALAPALAGRTALVADAATVAVALVLRRGVRESDRAQRLTSLFKGTALLFLVLACLAFRLRGGAAAASVPVRSPGAGLMAAAVAALAGIIYSYDGWTGSIYFAEEVRDASRAIPRALFGSVLSVMLLYLLINAAFLAVLPMGALAASPLAAASAATVVFGARGAQVVNAIVVVALPSAIVANLLMASRVAFALGRDRAGPEALSAVNRGGTPAGGLGASAAATVLFLSTGTFERVIAICSFLFVAMYALSFTSLFVLRRRVPGAPRPWRAWGHPWTTGLVLAGSVTFLAGTAVADPHTAGWALAAVALSYPAFRLVSGRAAAPEPG